MAVLALGVGGLALMGKVASSQQQVQVEQARAKAAQAESVIAHEQRLEAEVQPEIIEEQWQGATTHLLVNGQLEADRDMRRALIRLALADLNEREQWRGFGQAMLAMAVVSFIGALWWSTARKAVGDE